jgi:hypothetical protein
MDELDLIRRHEPDPTAPPPTAASRAHARALLDRVIALEISGREAQLEAPGSVERRPPEPGHGIEL